MSDAHRLAYTLSSAHPHERPRSLVLVRARARALRADVHTLPLHNATLRRDDSEVPLGRTREYLGPTPARWFPTWPRAPFSIPSIHGAVPRGPATFGDRVSPPVSYGVREWPPNRVKDRRCCHYAPVRAPPHVSRRAHPITNRNKGMGSSL